jgi:hypothetical protein
MPKKRSSKTARRASKPRRFLDMKRIGLFVKWYQKLPSSHQLTYAIALFSLTAATLIFTRFYQPGGPSSLDLFSLAPGQPNTAINFTETATNVPKSWVTANLHPIPDNGQGSTVEFWFKADPLPTDPAPPYLLPRNILFMKDTGVFGRNFSIYLQTDNKIHVLTSPNPDGVRANLYSKEPIEAGRWYHLAVAIQPTLMAADDSQLKLFLNGKLQHTISHQLPTNILNTLNRVNLGNIGPDSENIADFDGLIEDFRLSTSARYGMTTASDTFFPPAFNSLETDVFTQVLWRFNQNAQDSSGNDNHGQLMNDPTFVEITDEPTHQACVDYACVSVPGMGEDACSPTNPCPTPPPTPTPTPAITPTPTPTSSPKSTPKPPSQSKPSSPKEVTCSEAVPNGQPDLFQIDTDSSKATLYFAPASPPYTRYVIEYGEGNRIEHSTSFDANQATGALSATIAMLKTNTAYTFKVRAFNGCRPGIWSNQLAAKTTAANRPVQSYYRYGSTVTRPTTITPLRRSVQGITAPAPTLAPATAPPATAAPATAPPVAVTTPGPDPFVPAPPKPLSLWQRIINFFFGP